MNTLLTLEGVRPKKGTGCPLETEAVFSFAREDCRLTRMRQLGVFMRKENGFSLVELLLVVAVMLIIFAIAIPNFMRARVRANESSAVASIRAITQAAMTYSISYPDIGFPATLATLGGASPCTASSSQACLIDDALAAGTKGGYSFVWTGDGATPSVSFTLTGSPQVFGSSGERMFCTDQSAVIHYEPSGTSCGASSPTLE